MSSTNPQQKRDIVYCHECENEWYRDEHGLECPNPECHSDFTEIIEDDNDPRESDERIPPDTTPGSQLSQGDFYAPDPDEGDIDDLQWEETGPGRYRVRGTYRRDVPLSAVRGGQGQAGAGGGIMGLVGNMLQGMIGAQQQGAQQQGQQPEQQPNSPGRPTSAPPEEQTRDGNNGTFIRHTHGPGYSVTIASSSSGNLFPRNPNGPQPFQNQPDQSDQMLAQMFANIGAYPGAPPGMGGPGIRGGTMHVHGPGMMYGEDDDFQGPPPFMMGPGGMGPFANLFSSLFGPPGGVAGDAVFSQEALDRVITQLMEQHQSGNAPGPASEAAIKALPTKTISAADQGDSGKAECSICMDEVEIGGNVTVLPCSHWFHHECIKLWLSEHDTCPHCRQGIMPKDGEGRDATQPRSPTQAPLHDMRSPEYTRPTGAVPGSFFPRQNSSGGGGTEQQGRRNSTGGRTGNVFSRVGGAMRDAFGGGSGSSSGDGNSGSRG